MFIYRLYNNYLYCLLYENQWVFYIIGRPESLLRAVLGNNSVNFGIRGCVEHANLLWGDIKLKETSEGKEYLEFTGQFISC